MGRSGGLRNNTRHKFSRGFKNHGPLHLSTYLTNFHVGDSVDIKASANVQAGMPFRYYHGRTGRVFTVTRRGLGVVVAKRVRQRILNKRIYVRLEHVHPSRSREDFLKRVEHNTKARAASAGKEGAKADFIKRLPSQPKPAHFVRAKQHAPEDLHAIPYELVA